MPLFDFEVVPAKTSYMVTVTVTDGKDEDGNVDAPVDVDDTITVTIMVTDVNEAPECCLLKLPLCSNCSA